MPLELNLVCSPEEAQSNESILNIVHGLYGVEKNSVHHITILRRSIDARRSPIKINLRVALYQKGEKVHEERFSPRNYDKKDRQKKVVIIGFGPAGMFAALRCIELGLQPIVLERGKDVQARRRDLKSINRDNIVGEDSNYCFGEGGAGTYSDGKLYTRVKNKKAVRRVLEILVQHGATSEILVEAHPHIGTNRLPGVVKNIRECILNAGGEIHFETKMTDLILNQGKILGVIDQNNNEHIGDAFLLATGHSARDVFELLHQKNIALEAKEFAMGVRIEHPQELIDQIQYHSYPRGEYLPAASYKLVEQVKDRGVYSFCMCPGGFIVPSATAQEELVVNGMSPSKRDNKYANSGIVVSIEAEDWQEFDSFGPLAALEYQKRAEKMMWLAGGSTQTAGAQRLVDFCTNKVSTNLNDSSYIPGLNSIDMSEALSKNISDRLQIGFKKFGQKMKGYYTNEANIIGIESRTSSPVRIPRDKFLLNHPEVSNLFPCGEGGGFAGGIVSAGIDGERSTEAILKYLES